MPVASCEGELLVMQVITCGTVRLSTLVVVTVGRDWWQRFRHPSLNVVQLLARATTTGHHIEILYGGYRQLDMTLQLLLNNECRSLLVKTIDGNHIAYWPPVTRSRSRRAAATVQ
jgi:hypothetical protein